MSATGDGNPATGDGNPAAGDGNPTPGGQESPVGVARAPVWVAEADLVVMGDSRPHGGDAAGAARVMGAAEVLGQEAGEQVAGLAGAMEGGSDEEDSDIEPAEEGEEVAAGGQGLVVDAYQFPMVGFRFMFLDLVHSLLYRIYYNDHILVRPSSGRVVVRRQRAMPEVAAGVPALPVSQSPGHGAAAQEPEDQPEAEAEEESATWETAEEAEEESEQAATAPERPQEAAAQEETAKYQYEDSEEDSQDTENKEEEEKFNKKQGPEKDVDPTESRP